MLDIEIRDSLPLPSADFGGAEGGRRVSAAHAAVEGERPDLKWIQGLVNGLEYPAWLAGGTGEVLHANVLQGDYRHLAEAVPHGLAGDWRAGDESVRLRVRHRYRDEVEVNVCRFPVLTEWSRDPKPPLTLHVVCWPEEEARRDRRVIGLLLQCLAEHCGAGDRPPPGLTRQQQTIFKLLREKRTYKEIAAQLGVAHSTIRVQIATMRKRLGERDVPVLRR